MARISQVPHILVSLLIGTLPAGVGFTRPDRLEVVSELPPESSFDVILQARGGTDRLWARLASGRETETVLLVPSLNLPGFRAYRLAAPMRLVETGAIRPDDGRLRARTGDTLTLEAGGRRAECSVRNPVISVDTSRDSQ